MPLDRRLHLLVVDDEASIGDNLGAALGPDYVIHTASTGAKACAALRRHPIAAILLADALGHEDALGLVPRFRALMPVPIILLAGRRSETLAVRALRAGVEDYVKKRPLKLPDLRAALERLLAPGGRLADPALRARRFLEGRPVTPYPERVLAGKVGLSERHVRRLFGQTFGKTPRRYLVEIRLKRAQELLRTTTLHVNQIAQEVGFKTKRTFNRQFKHAYRMTPVQYRAAQASRR